MGGPKREIENHRDYGIEIVVQKEAQRDSKRPQGTMLCAHTIESNKISLAIFFFSLGKFIPEIFLTLTRAQSYRFFFSVIY